MFGSPRGIRCERSANLSLQLAPPKAKYVEHILVATHAGDAGVAEIFRALQNRLRDSTWTIVFKSLIIVHLMIREGEPNVTLKYLADSPSKLAISNFSDGTSKQYSVVNARGPTESGYPSSYCDGGSPGLNGINQGQRLIDIGVVQSRFKAPIFGTTTTTSCQEQKHIEIPG